MSSYEDRRREEARRRLAMRQGGYSDPYEPRMDSRSRSGSYGAAPSLSSLHQVSPQMRERYSSSGQGRAGSRRSTHYDDWDDYDDVTWDDGRGSDSKRFNTPSVDPIGGSSLNGRRGGGLGMAFWAVLGLVVVLLVVVVALASSNCSSSDVQESTPMEGQQTQQAAEAAADGTAADSASASGSAASGNSGSSTASTTKQYGIDRTKLEAILDEETSNKLLMRAETSEDAKWIAQHPEAYAGDGEVVQAKILTLAANEPAAYSYVRNYPDKYPMDKPQDGKINTVVTGRNIPRLYQWDEVWGYTTYSGAAFGLTGCAPTCMAMVYQGFTGDTSMSPYDMGELAESDGFMTDEEGTIGSYFLEEGKALGLQVHEIGVTKSALKEALQSGEVVVVNFGPGDFTQHGHYVVLTGVGQDEEIIMNDPYSAERSEKHWGYDIIVENAISFYAFG